MRSVQLLSPTDEDFALKFSEDVSGAAFAEMLRAAVRLKPSLLHAGLAALGLGWACHKAVTYLVLYPLFRLLFGTLYPAYASYKAVRTKNVKEYVKWMMYWIVFALFTCIEIFTDLFLSWFPFYYEIKIILVIWLLSPATKGSSILYRKFVHPTLSSREQEIDEYINKAKEQSYRQVLDLGSKGVSALMQTAIRGGGGIVNQLKKSYSLSDLSDPSHEETIDETDVIISDPRLKRRRSPHRSASSTSAVYFSAVDVRSDRIASIQSAEDISSGYSSGEGLYAAQSSKLTSRETIHRTGSLTRSRTTRVTRSGVARKAAASDDSDDNEVFDTNIIFHNCNSNRTEKILEDIGDSSSSEAEFLDTLDSLHENLGEDLNKFNTSNENSPLLTACVERQERLDEVQSSLTTDTSFPSELDGEAPQNISNIQNNLKLLNITKDVDTFSNFLQHLINVKNEKFEDTEEQIDIKSNTVNNFVNVDIQRNLEILDRKLDKLANTPHKYIPIAPEIINTSSGVIKGTFVSKTEELHNSEDSILPCPGGRGGRYNKKAAPAPPANLDANPAIKATLVLKPGVLKTIGPKESSCKEIFVQSPKSKRRSLINRSHSSVSSCSSNTSRSKASLSKLLKLPRKISFWNKNELTVPKREHRLSDSFIHQNSLPLLDTRIQSKSDNNLVPNNQNIVIPLHGPSLSRSGSQLSLKSLRESPLARRRLTIIRRYVDEDID